MSSYLVPLQLHSLSSLNHDRVQSYLSQRSLIVNLHGQRQLAVAILPISTNDSMQPLSGLDMTLVRFHYIEIHPIHVHLNPVVNYTA